MDLGAVAIGVGALTAVLVVRQFQLRGAGDLDAAGTRFVPVSDVAALEDLLSSKNATPSLLFLHDPGCPISARAHRELARLGGEIPTVNVQRSHDVSRAVERATGIRHESPQVFVFAHGHVAWSASHGAITAGAVRRAMAEAHEDSPEPSSAGNLPSGVG